MENENQPKGSHSIEVDVEKWPSGVYYCTLSTSGNSKTIKLLVSH
jgi:hypothetical protein